MNIAIAPQPIFTHEGAPAARINEYQQLRRSVLTCLLWEPSFYEKGDASAARIAELVRKVAPEKVAALAIEARDKMLLRHVPLFLVRELARIKGNGPLVETALGHVIQRADELAEFLAMYWSDKRQPLSAGVKRGLAAAFQKFDAYRLAKYNRDNKIKLRDVLFLCHAKPKDAEQGEVWKKLIDGTLESPDTWEVELSAGKDKRETFTRLLSERKLGGMAVLRNLRNMEQAGVDESMVRSRLADGVSKALPFRFVTAARHAPRLEDALEAAMFKGVADLESLPGRTGFLIDVSGSMDYPLSSKSETTRMDAACGLAILLREKASIGVEIASFSSNVAIVAPRRGFALRDAVKDSQPHMATMLGDSLAILRSVPAWQNLDRLIVITDEQSHDRVPSPWVANSYMVNVAAYQNGVGYGNGWTHIDGWSDRIVDYIREFETETPDAE